MRRHLPILGLTLAISAPGLPGCAPRSVRSATAAAGACGVTGSAHAHAPCAAGAAACIDRPAAGISACFAPGTDPAYAEAIAAALLGDGPPQYSLSSRWSFTATNGATGSAGTPITLTYSFVPDNSTGDPTTSNAVHATFDAQFGSRPVWKALFRRMFDDWSAQTGVTFVEVSDDGAPWPGSQGSLGQRGDVRIVAWEMDGPYGVLAYNYYPNGGDMAIDRDEDWAAAADDYRFLRNTLMHELGHGLGLQHVLPRDGTKLMEAFLNTGFDGPQDDDVRGTTSHYGDPREPNASAAAATDLGPIPTTTTVSRLALHAPGDVDWFAVQASAGSSVAVSAAPVGGVYLIGPDPGTPVSVDTRAINALSVEVYNQSGASLLAASPAVSAGQTAQIATISVPGGNSGLKIRVFTTGSTSQVQRYTLTVTPQGPSSTYTLLVGSNTTGSVPVSFAPAAQGGATSAQTPAALVFAAGAAVSITAPLSAGGMAFARWDLDTAPQPAGQRTISVSMTANRAAQAIFGPGVSVAAGPPQSIVAGEAATLSATISGGTAPYAVQWSPSAGLSHSAAATTLAQPATTTTYSVTVTDSLGATASDAVTVTVLPTLSVDAGGDRTVAAGQPITLVPAAAGGSPPFSFTWSPLPGAASVASDGSLSVSVETSTTFTVVVADSSGRTASATVNVTVAPPLTVNAGSDRTIVAGGSAVLSATAAGGLPPYAYVWSPAGVSLEAAGRTVRVLPGADTHYTVTATDALGQQASDGVQVRLAAALLATASASSASVRSGEFTLLEVTASGGLPPYAYAWLPAEGLAAPDGRQTWAAPYATTNYAVVVSDALGQNVVASVRVVVPEVAGATSVNSFAPAMPSPCGFGFATAVPFMLLGPAALRRGRRAR